jgi:tetratricopeptide (TPR) repeat protein
MSRELRELVRLGKGAFAKMDYERAERHLREALAGGAEYPDIHYTLGLIDHQRGNYRQALDHFAKAVSIHPEYTEALLSQSITLNDVGRYEEARAAYDRAVRILSRYGIPPERNMLRGRIANLHRELAEIYLALGQHDEAVFEFRKALVVAPGYPDLRVRLVTALREAGQAEEALAEVDAFLVEAPGHAPALIQKGILLYLSGEAESARRAWEEALYRDPLNRIVQIYLNTLNRERPAD